MNRDCFHKQFGHCEEAVMLQAPDGSIRYANPAAGMLFGFDSPEALCGKSPEELSPEIQPDGQHTRILVQQCAQRAAEVGTCRFEWTVRHRITSRSFPCEIRFTSMTFQGGQYILSAIRDITEEKNQIENLRRSRNLLKQTEVISQSGTWVYDVAADQLWWSDGVYRLFGMGNADGPLDFNLFLQSVHPDDRGKVAEIYLQSVEKGQDCYEVEHRIIRRDNKETRILHEKCDHEKDTQGKVIRSIGHVQDITGLREQEARFRTLVSNLPGFVYMAQHDSRGACLFLSEKFRDITGYPCNEFLVDGARSFFSVILAEDLEAVTADLAEAEQKEGRFMISYRIRCADGQIRNMLDHGTIRPGTEGESKFVIEGYLMDVTEREASARDLLEKTRDLSKANDELRASRKAALNLMQDFDLQRKRAEDALRKVKESETYTQLLFDRFPLGLAECRRDGTLVNSNPRLLQILGAENPLPENSVSFWELFPETDEKNTQRALLQEKGQYGPFQTVCLRPDGGRVPVRLQGLLLERKGEQYMWSTVEDITEEQLLTEELLAAREAAETSSQSKSAFVANLSHEIRTPLNAIVGMNHLLSRSGLTGEQQDFIRKQQVACSALLSVVNEVLDFSKLESGKLTIVPHLFELEGLLEELSVMTALVAQSKGLEYLFDLDPELPREVIGDRTRIRQVLLNLCNNAIKFTQQGSVMVRCRLKSGTKGEDILSLQVQDTGIGIPDEEMDRIFDSFHQADPSTTRTYGGTGLGLAICRELTGLMLGTLNVDSCPGSGSTFTFEIPVQLPDSEPGSRQPGENSLGLRVILLEDYAPSRRLISAMLKGAGCEVEAPELSENLWGAVTGTLENFRCDVLLCDIFLGETDAFAVSNHIAGLPTEQQPKTVILMSGHNIEDIRKLTGTGPVGPLLCKPFTCRELIGKLLEVRNPDPEGAEAMRSCARNRLSGVRILLVEDNQLNQEVATELLSAEGAIVDIAAGGVEAIHSVQGARYDLILMDLHMPEMDGYEATRRIRELKGMENLPLIALSATTRHEVETKIRQAGLNDHLSKPVEPETLVRVVNKWVRTGQSSPGPLRHPVDQVPPCLTEVDGLAAREGLRNLEGNLNLYMRMLRRFCEEQSDATDLIHAAWRNGDLADAARRAHTLKGLLKLLGFHHLARGAGRTEQALLKNRPADVEAELKRLDVDLARALGPLKNAMQQVPDSPNDPAPVTISLEEARERLLRLHEKLHRGDARAVEDWKNLRPSLCHFGLTRHLPELDVAMETYDFTKAMETLHSVGEYLRQKKGEHFA
jgi:two-component system, sensor histidine kinase and response regulator